MLLILRNHASHHCYFLSSCLIVVFCDLVLFQSLWIVIFFTFYFSCSVIFLPPCVSLKTLQVSRINWQLDLTGAISLKSVLLWLILAPINKACWSRTSHTVSAVSGIHISGTLTKDGWFKPDGPTFFVYRVLNWFWAQEISLALVPFVPCAARAAKSTAWRFSLRWWFFFTRVFLILGDVLLLSFPPLHFSFRLVWTWKHE